MSKKIDYEKDVKPHFNQIKNWLWKGLQEKDIIKMLPFSKEIFYKFKRQKPEFKELLKKGKEWQNAEIVNTLWKRAMGYEFEEITQELIVGKDGETNKKLIKKTKKHIPAELTAIIFILKNRSKDWRNEHNQAEVDDDKLLKKIAEMMKQ